MQNIRFFEKKGPFPFSEILKEIDPTKDLAELKNFKVYGIETLINAKENEITFLNSNKYQKESLKTKAFACITSLNLSKFLPEKCIKIDVKNVLFAVTQVSRLFYPNADLDYPDLNLMDSNSIKDMYPKVKFGKNVMIGKDVKIGNDSFIGTNSIIESKVEIGSDCIIGSSVVLKNALISDNVNIQDGCKIGIKGFGFIPIPEKNLRIPHTGNVVIEEGVEIGANCTIDRGSLSNTFIGKNTFIDNQVHIAHNVRIGKNCMIAGQVGFAGSTVIGDKVLIGGQAGVSGHLKIGNNVKIGGGSGVINDIPDNQQVMGYPAVPLKDFIKQRKK